MSAVSRPTVAGDPTAGSSPVQPRWGVTLPLAGIPLRDHQKIITGLAASRGTVQGRAKVVHDLSEASKVEPGRLYVVNRPNNRGIAHILPPITVLADG